MMKDFEAPASGNIEEYQNRELKKLLLYLNNNSRFYKEHFRKFKIDIFSVENVKDLVKLPVTTKNDLQLRSSDFLCTNRNQIAEYCTTSGTSGNPVTIALTERDLKRLAYNEYLSFLSTGGSAEDVYQLIVSLDRQFMAGIAYYSGIRMLGAAVIRGGPGNFNMQIENIRHFSPNVLIAVPSFILNLVKFAEEKEIDLNATSVRKIICIGENIRNENFTYNALGERIVNAWNVELFSTYASSEQQTAFTECSYGRGGHHHPELLIFEILDEDNNQLPPGEYGELTITTLGVEGMPLLRYKTGDICAYYTEPCLCGRKTFRISPIKGRKHQLIKFNGTTLYPQSVFNVLNTIEDIDDYVVRVFKNEIDTDEIEIHIALSDKSNEASSGKIIQSIQSALRVLPRIKYSSLSEIQSLQSAEAKRKISKLLDLR